MTNGLNHALETLVADMTRIRRNSSHVVHKFLLPIIQLDAAQHYKEQEFPFAEIVVTRLYLQASQQIALVGERHQRLQFLLTQLSWYEYRKRSSENWEHE